MKILRAAGIGISYIIKTIILAVSLILAGLAVLWGYFSLQFFMFSGKNYLLFVTDDFSLIPIIMVVILIIFLLKNIKERFLNNKKKQELIMDEIDEPIDTQQLNKLDNVIYKLLNAFWGHDKKIKEIIKRIKICFILVSMVVIYIGMTSYSILYSDSIKVGSPINPKGVVYKYNDIKNVNVGISKSSKKSYSPYYKVIFNDGKSVNFFGASMQEGKGLRFENILVDLDKKLINQGVVKNVDKENFEKYSEKLDIDFVNRIEKLFDDK